MLFSILWYSNFYYWFNITCTNMDKNNTIDTGTDNAELVKRTAAALAHATKGRSRIVESKKQYDRKRFKKGTKKEIDSD